MLDAPLLKFPSLLCYPPTDYCHPPAIYLFIYLTCTL